MGYNDSSTQALSLTQSDSWQCPECDDKKSGKGRGRPKKQDTRKTSSDADNNLNNEGKKSAGKKKIAKKAGRMKTVVKKQKMSKEYISDEDMTDTEEETGREPAKNFRKDGQENTKTNPCQKNLSLKTVDKIKAGHKAESLDRNVTKWEEAKKGQEMVNRGCEGYSDSDRVPVEQLLSSTEED